MKCLLKKNLHGIEQGEIQLHKEIEILSYIKILGADGIKTGYLAVEKYSLASSINRNGRRLIAVGSGFNSKNSRSRESSKLLTYGLTNFDLVNISKAK